MNSLFTNIRFYILLFSITFSLAVYLFITSSPLTSGQTQIIRLEQIYALTAVIYLYLALLAGPLCYTFPGFPIKEEYLKARRALGVSAFYFALIHANFAFFGQLGGFAGLPFLNERFLLAITCSFTALIILSLLAMTSFDAVIKKITFPRWKFLQRFIYLASILILIHALMLGTHFSDLSATIPLLFFIAISFLLILEAPRFDVYLQKKIKLNPHYHVTVILVIVLLIFLFFRYVNPFGNTTNTGVGIHSEHMSQMKNATTTTKTQKEKLMVHFIDEQPIIPQQETTLTFQMHSSTGKPVTNFTVYHEKLLHLIIVDSSLTYFEHVHPEFNGSEFAITTKFPHDGKYYLYFDFQTNAVDQQITQIIDVGDVSSSQPTMSLVDTTFTKIVDEYKITLQAPASLSAKKMSDGEQTLTFLLEDAKTEKPIKTLKPYLGSYGHLVMINQKSYQYLHIHPMTASKKNRDGGPSVSFMPMGLSESVQPGIYRIFAQFNPNDKLILVDFTIEVK